MKLKLKSWTPVYIFLVGLVVILASLYTILTRKPAGLGEKPTPYPTAVPGTIDTPPPPGQGGQYEQSTKKIADTETSKIKKDQAVTHLLDIMPQKGQYFKMSYDINNNKFHVIINKDHKNEAEAELNDLLHKNGIESQTWITNLGKIYN